jgi:aspartate/methionine/tyrosine aminotransferase
MYALQLLEATGVCMVPGSGFGQEHGTFHIRSTFLPSEAEMEEFVERIQKFHGEFMGKMGGIVSS